MNDLKRTCVFGVGKTFLDGRGWVPCAALTECLCEKGKCSFHKDKSKYYMDAGGFVFDKDHWIREGRV